MGGPYRRGKALQLLAALVFLPVLLAGVAYAAETAVVEEVLDGDTLRVVIGGSPATVRLIGIDAPERSHPTVGKEFYGDESAEYISSLCLGKTVRMEKGAEESDRYDRLLRYVFLSPPDGRLLNLEMIRAGMARAYTRFPFSRRDEFVAAEFRARRDGKGLWRDAGTAKLRWLISGKSPVVEVYPAGGGAYAVVHRGWALDETPREKLAREIEWVLKTRAELSDAEFARKARERGYLPVDPATDEPSGRAARPPKDTEAVPGAAVSWEDARRHIDERVVVEGTIVRAHRSKSVLYLNFHPNWKRYLTVVIPAKDIPLFPGDPEAAFMGKMVRVRGEVVLRRERLEMVVRDPANITIVP